MKFLKYLQEEYFGATKTKSGFSGQEELLTVFKNPDRSEMKEAGEDGVIRFLADFQHSTLYIWNALLGTHENVIKKFNLSLVSYCRGSGHLNSSVKIDKIEGECVKATSQTINSNKSWLSRYFDYNNFEAGVAF
jgi:hypothetical protein